MNPLLLEIRRVLLKECDPIGVQDVEEAEDEYDAYADEVWRLLIEGCRATLPTKSMRIAV